jgi:hypothetical protein
MVATTATSQFPTLPAALAIAVDEAEDAMPELPPLSWDAGYADVTAELLEDDDDDMSWLAAASGGRGSGCFGRSSLEDLAMAVGGGQRKRSSANLLPGTHTFSSDDCLAALDAIAEANAGGGAAAVAAAMVLAPVPQARRVGRSCTVDGMHQLHTHGLQQPQPQRAQSAPTSPFLSMASLSIHSNPSTPGCTPPGSPGPIRSGSRTPKGFWSASPAAWPLTIDTSTPPTPTLTMHMPMPTYGGVPQPAAAAAAEVEHCDCPIFKDIEGEWITRLSDMPIVTLNAFIKKVNMSKADAADLKKVRRQRKNKVYTKNSRERRAGKRQSQPQPRPASPTEESYR